MDTQCIELLFSIVEYMNKLYAGIKDFSEGVHSGSLSGIPLLSDICDGIAWTIKACTIINTEKELGVETELNVLQGFIEDILNALENKDYVFLADILEYDVMPCLETLYEPIVLLVPVKE